MTTTTAPMFAKSLDVPDETIPIPNGRIAVVHLGGMDAIRATFQPGFRWSKHSKPMAGTELCEVPHTGYVISGRNGIRMADGTERELGPGDAYNIPAGHDGWTVGDEACVCIDFAPAQAPTSPPPNEADTSRLPIFARPSLENSSWYGSALVSLLATAEMTGGRYSLQVITMTKGFAPPAPHRHGPEDFYILRGQLHCWVGSEELVAVEGDYVRTLPGVWHTLQAESDDVVALQIFSPPGLEELFRQVGRPAEALEMPAGRVGPPDPDRIRAFGLTHGIEFAPPGTTPQDIAKLPR